MLILHVIKHPSRKPCVLGSHPVLIEFFLAPYVKYVFYFFLIIRKIVNKILKWSGMKIIMRVFVSYKLKLFFTVCSHSQLIVSSCILNCRLMNTSTDGAHKKCIRINILIILLNSTFPFLYCTKTKKFCNACYTLYLLYGRNINFYMW